MKVLRRIDPGKAWAWLFVIVFLMVPLCMVTNAVLYAAVVLVLLYLLGRTCDLPRFPLILFAVALALRIAAVVLIPTPVQSDFATLLNAAEQMKDGGREYLEDVYFQRWAYQLGFVAFEALLLKLGDSVLLLKLVNCLAGAGATVLIYLLALELADRRAARIVSVVYCFSPMGVLYMTVLSNQVFPTFLLLAGLYYLAGERFRSPAWLRFGVFGLLLSLANLLRPESIIPLVAAVLSLLLLLRKGNWKQSLLCAGVLFAVYFGLNALFNWLFRVTGLSPEGLVNNAPYWKFLLGFNRDSGGYYTEADGLLLSDPEAAWATVRERLQMTLPQFYALFEKKIDIFWGYSALGWVFSPFLSEGLPLLGDAERTQNVVTILHGVNRWFQFASYVYALIGTVGLIRRDKLRLPALMLLNILFVTFGVYLLIEVQPRYAFFAQAVCMVLAAPGVEGLCPRQQRQTPLVLPVKGEEGNG